MSGAATKRPLEGQTYCITGAGSGIGLATTALAAERGAKVLGLVFDMDGQAAFLKACPSGVPLILDLADAEAVNQQLPTFLAHNGPISGLVNCAGIFVRAATAETDEALYRRTMGVNLDAPYRLCRTTIPYLSNGGAVVLVSSHLASVGHPAASAYSASKSGVNGLARSLAFELADRGIRVNAVAPGPIATAMTIEAQSSKEMRDFLLSGLLIKRFGLAEEVAASILFLLSEEAAFITGQILHVDGGYTAR